VMSPAITASRRSLLNSTSRCYVYRRPDGQALG
jgi:hypothetical protein